MSQIEYNPRVNDQSGAIMGQAVAASAQTRAAGDQAYAQGLASGATSLASGIQQAVGSYLASRSAKQRNEGEIDSAVQSGYLTPEYGQKLLDMPLDKQAGALARARESFKIGDQINLREASHAYNLDYLGAQTEAARSLAEHKQAITPPPVRNPNIIYGEKGTFAYDPVTGQATEIKAPNGGSIVKPPSSSTDAMFRSALNSPQGASAPSGLPQVTTQQQYDSLPSGTQYIDSQGNSRTKP